MTPATRLAWRAALAIALMVSFYVLAVTVAGLLLATPVLLFKVSKGLALYASLTCFLAGLIILRAIVPRGDEFEPPGPLLTPDTQPELFAEICDLAVRTGQDEPAEVYLIPEPNAWVRHRTGVMGFGSRRLMGIGLPMLQALTVPELRAVLAHEFGHFHGGDVALGPWIHKTHAALARTLAGLKTHSQWLSLPFIWYGELFFRITHSVSRHQEMLADRLAASIVGTETFASALRANNSALMAFAPYWQADVEPVLTSGFAPPLAAGFDACRRTPDMVSRIARALKRQALTEQQGPYDTHPPLSDRLAALGASRSNRSLSEGPPALSLLRDVPRLEKGLVNLLARSAQKAVPISWNEVGEKVWLPQWQLAAPRLQPFLAGVTPGSLPWARWTLVGRRFLGVAEGDPATAADFVIGAVVAVVLVRAGLRVESHPGEEHALVGLGERVEVFRLRERFAKEPEYADTWRSLCDRAGIADVDLTSSALGPDDQGRVGPSASCMAILERDGPPGSPQHVLTIQAPAGDHPRRKRGTRP